MKVICIDFETYYSQIFSLTKVTTEEYIRSPEFETIGVAVQVDGEEPQWCTGTKATIKKFLDSFELDKNLVVAHNAMFDMAILNWQFDIRPKAIADTLSMARAIHGTEVGGSLAKLAEHYELGVKGEEVLKMQGKRRLDISPSDMVKYGEYCVNDVVLTLELFKRLSAYFPPAEFRLIDLTIRMFTEPTLRLDDEVLRDHLDDVKKKKQVFLDQYDREVLMSNDKFAQLLKVLGAEPPRKISNTTGKETWAFAKTDEGFKALLEHENTDIQMLASCRLGVKSTIEETRTQRFIEISERGLLPIPLRYYAAHTGRWGGDDKVNLQNLPRSSQLKYAIKAQDGYVVIDSDSSQIEARTLAWLAEQNDLVDAFEKGEDVYKIMASSIYNKDITQITKDERFVGKTTILGCFGADTEVLTDSGWKRIVEVQGTDLLWDGEEWVKHQGLLPQGEKEVITAWGVDATPEHEILTEHGWLEWSEVVTNPTHFLSALNKANLPSLIGNNTISQTANQQDGTQLSNAPVAGRVESTGITSKLNVLLGAIPAPKFLATKLVKSIGGTKILSLIGRIGNVCLTAYQVASHVVIQSLVKHTRIMAVEGLQFMHLGVQTEKSSYATLYRSMDGMTQNETLTASTTTLGMHQTIYGLRPSPKMQEISDELENLNCVSKNLKKKIQTYDIAYSGSRNRYTIKTSHGAIIVHNCGYGMGAKKFQAQLKTFGVDLSEAETQRIISVYRERYEWIPLLWRKAGDALDAILNDQAMDLGRGGVLKVEGKKGIRLPNGLYIKYPNLRKVENENGKLEYVYDTRKGKATIPNRIYGGKVVENVCQALARIIIGYQMLIIAKKYKVVMTVHDAIAIVAPEAEKDAAQEFVEMCMRLRPDWALELPLNCESGVGVSYGDC